MAVPLNKIGNKKKRKQLKADEGNKELMSSILNLSLKSTCNANVEMLRKYLHTLN